MSTAQQIRFWLIASAIFIGIVWVLSPMLLPFVAGMAIAYFLNPVVTWLRGAKMPRWSASALVLLAFILAVVVVILLLVPLLKSQIMALSQAIPGYAEKVQTQFIPWVENLMAGLSPEDMERLRTAASQYGAEAVNWLGRLLQEILSRGMAIFDILTLLVITPVVAFYLLRDWDKMEANVDRTLPRRYHDTIRAQLHEIDRTLAGFVRGQGLVCIALGLIYAIGLSLVGLNFGATIGITAGILSFIPYVGSGFVLVFGLIFAAMQFGDGAHLLMVLGVYVVGQILEGYVLTPKLVGDRVGLHPVWVLFALFAGGSLLGFTGVLIAVPVAAVIGVLVRFGLRQYMGSRYYQDHIQPPAA